LVEIEAPVEIQVAPFLNFLAFLVESMEAQRSEERTSMKELLMNSLEPSTSTFWFEWVVAWDCLLLK
jgi:hypothetical protein